MAEIQEKDSGGGKKGKPKKMNIHVDFTPMVDMNMLLITFFMLCTTLNNPQAMDIALPSRDEVVKGEETKISDKQAITVILEGDNKIFYFEGKTEDVVYNYTLLKETDYSAEGLRATLMNKNSKILTELRELKQKRLNGEITDEQLEAQTKTIKSDEEAPVVVIKATDKATYRNLIDALDEMQITGIGAYAIVDMTDIDQFLLDNWHAKGTMDPPEIIGGESESAE